MTAKFVSYNGMAYRVLHTGEGGMWLISYEEPTNPFFYIGDGLERIQTPEEFLEQSSKKKLTAAQQSRLALIHPLLDAQPRFYHRPLLPAGFGKRDRQRTRDHLQRSCLSVRNI